MRKAGSAAAVAIALLGAPWLALLLSPTGLEGGYGFVAGAYLVVAGIAWWWRTGVLEAPGRVQFFPTATTVLALAAALLASLVAGPFSLMIVSVSASCLIFAIAEYEKRPGLIYWGSGLIYLALTQIVGLGGLPSWNYGLVTLALGLLLFGFGAKTGRDQAKFAAALRYGGLIGPFLGVLLTIGVDGAGEMPMLCLALGGGLVLVEAFIENSIFMAVIAGGLVLAAYDWLLVYGGVVEAQLYSLPWIAYFTYLAYRTWKNPTARVSYVSLALATLTLPMMAEASGDGGIYYGAEVVFIGMTLAIIGSATSNLLITWWGGGVALLEILYLVPKYLWPGSEIPLICFSLGLAALAIAAMVRMSRPDIRDEEDRN